MTTGRKMEVHGLTYPPTDREIQGYANSYYGERELTPAELRTAARHMRNIRKLEVLNALRERVARRAGPTHLVPMNTTDTALLTLIAIMRDDVEFDQEDE